MTYELSALRAHTTEEYLSFTEYCVLKFTPECLMATPKIENNYNRFLTVSGSTVQNMVKSSL